MPSNTASALKQAPELENLQKDAASLRRDQLTDIAARLIEAEGLDAVKHARIAKLAGCTRALVYHYFPRRSDIFAEIVTRFYERLDAVIPISEQQAALRENLDGSKASSLAFFGTLFDILDDGGWGSLILVATPELHPEFVVEGVSAYRHFETRYAQVIASRFDMTTLDSELFFQYSINISKTIFMFYRQGLLSKEQALVKMDETLNLLLNPYREIPER